MSIHRHTTRRASRACRVVLLSVSESTRAGKKLVAVFDVGGITRSVHFGAASYGDYTAYHAQDPALAAEKRRGYIRRHGATEDWTDPTTAGTLSRYVLWELPTIPAAVAAYRRRFGV